MDDLANGSWDDEADAGGESDSVAERPQSGPVRRRGTKGRGMAAQPVHPHQPEPRVPRTIGGISEALRGARRAQFLAEVLVAEQGADLDATLTEWWGRAMLDSDPQRDRIHAAAEAGTLPTMSWDEIARRRRANDGAMPGE